MNMGSYNRPTPQSTKNSRLQSLPIGPHRRKHSHQIPKQTTTEGLHMTIKIPICIPILLHQKEGQETTTHARLPKVKCTHSQKSLPITSNPRNHRQSTRH